MTYVLTVIWGLWTEHSTSELIKWLLWKGLSHITVITICRIQASFFLLLYSYPGDDPVQYKWQWNLLYWCYMSTFNSVARSFATSFCKNCHRGLICSVLIYVFFICGQLSVGLSWLLKRDTVPTVLMQNAAFLLFSLSIHLCDWSSTEAIATWAFQQRSILCASQTLQPVEMNDFLFSFIFSSGRCEGQTRTLAWCIWGKLFTGQDKMCKLYKICNFFFTLKLANKCRCELHDLLHRCIVIKYTSVSDP